MVNDARMLLLQLGVTAVLAVILLGGTIGLLLVGRPVPDFLVSLDGVVVTAVFAHGAFFAQARASAPTAAALSDTLTRYHQLATIGIQSTSPTPTGTGGLSGPDQLSGGPFHS